MKPEISEEIISGWRNESHDAMSERLTKHKEAGDHIGYHAWSDIDAQNAYYEGYIAAKSSSHDRILELEREKSRLNSFCNEFVYGEENPNYYKTMQEKLTKRDELLKRSLLWNEAMLKIAIVSIDEEKQRAETTSQLYQLVADIKQLEQEK